MKPYIIRNRGWVTPQLDNILGKARLDQLRGQLLELRGKSKKRKTPKRYNVFILTWTAPTNVRSKNQDLARLT